ncbi:hypothetical protein ACRALDRAFT_207442 [Sodiomyces alcalophilus JCM 7366]|uniref:uncharacterized protein n=1 Tax=Sodiomyces alcalophilus JCM 7366 TaxID=591952 RepID=UPI0039B4363C
MGRKSYCGFIIRNLYAGLLSFVIRDAGKSNVYPRQLDSLVPLLDRSKYISYLETRDENKALSKKTMETHYVRRRTVVRDIPMTSAQNLIAHDMPYFQAWAA